MRKSIGISRVERCNMSRDDIIDWLYDINVRADISIEEMADEIMEIASQQNVK